MRPHMTHMLLGDILGQASDHNCVIWGSVPPVFLSRRPGKDSEMWSNYSGLANLSRYRPGLRSRLLSRLLLLSSSALSLQDLLMRLKSPSLNARVLMQSVVHLPIVFISPLPPIHALPPLPTSLPTPRPAPAPPSPPLSAPLPPPPPLIVSLVPVIVLAAPAHRWGWRGAAAAAPGLAVAIRRCQQLTH